MTENTTLQSIRRWLWGEGKSSLQDEDAFTRLYEQTYLTVFRFVYGLSGGSHQEAEDLTAETYARAWKQRDDFRGNEKAALGWLLRIARNLAIDLSRRRKVRDVDEEIEIDLLADSDLLPEADLVSREQAATLWRMLKDLPGESREMLILRYMLGWQVKQIASHLEVNENTVSVRIQRALKRLHAEWTQVTENDDE